MENNNCLVCNKHQVIEHSLNNSSGDICQTCPRCLKFIITKSAINTLQELRKDKTASYEHILNWMNERNIANETPIITYKTIDRLRELSSEPPSFSEKSILLLQELINQYGQDNAFNALNFKSNIYFQTASLSTTEEQTFLLLQHLIENFLVKEYHLDEIKKSNHQYKITRQGFDSYNNINTICVICKNKNITTRKNKLNVNEIIVRTKACSSDIMHQVCPSCGEFKISNSALKYLNSENNNTYIKKISGWISKQNKAGEAPLIKIDNLDSILTAPLPSVMDRATNILQEASKNLEWLGDLFYGYKPAHYGISYSLDENDIDYLLNILKENNFIADRNYDGKRNTYGILSKGHMHLENQKTQPSTSKQGFVAMWFDPDLNSAYNDGIKTGILNAGYSSVRMDRTEHVNSIDDEMIVQIKASKFVVADFTGHRGNVYFEAGYAMGLNIPVIWSCRKDHVSDLLFDIRQFNYIRWETPEELAERLRLRIEAIIGPGPNKLISMT